MNSSENEAREVGLVLGERCATCLNFWRDTQGGTTCHVWPDLPPMFRVSDGGYITRLSYSRLADRLSQRVPGPQSQADYLDYARQAAAHPPCTLYERGPSS